ncbi:MAG: PorT family protein [Cyclobacteriaceae bacterium]|nr:PorT family protein [Cyclobacteriaceae bacterium]
MQTPDIRHLLHVHGPKVIWLLLLCGSSWNASAQHYAWARRNNPEFDRRTISYGFAIGLHTSAYALKYSDKFVTPQMDTVHSVYPVFSPGFSLGFLLNYRFNDQFDLRLMPKAGFYDHKLYYNYTDHSQRSVLVETTVVEFPILIKYKSQRRGNVRMYMLGGFTPGIEASGKNDVQSSTASLSIRKQNISLDTGLGFDFYFPLFKLSQEIRFSHGLVNMLGPEASSYKDPITRLSVNTISVYFIFQ